jgi:broad specificity phosphatase PhoE
MDEPLEEREIAKIAALGWQAPRAQTVLSGPERRAQQTAQALGISAEIAVELRDCDYGVWSGSTLAEVEQRHPEEVVAWLTNPGAAPHGGESILQLIARVAAWLEQQRVPDHTIAVTHPAVIRSAIVHALQAPPSSFWRIDIAPPLADPWADRRPEGNRVLKHKKFGKAERRTADPSTTLRFGRDDNFVCERSV